MQSTNQLECYICYEPQLYFAVVCNSDLHHVCRSCFLQLQDKSICPVCRQPNPIFNYQLQDNESSDDYDDIYIPADQNDYGPLRQLFQDPEQQQPRRSNRIAQSMIMRFGFI